MRDVAAGGSGGSGGSGGAQAVGTAAAPPFGVDLRRARRAAGLAQEEQAVAYALDDAPEDA